MKLLNNLSIRSKLLSGFLLVFLVIVCFALYLLFSFNAFYQQLLTLDTQADRRTTFVQLNANVSELSNAIKSYILTGDRKWEGEYDATAKNLSDELAAINIDDEEKGNFIKLKDTVTQLQGVELLILAKTNDGNREEAIKLFDTRYVNQEQQAANLVKGLVKDEDVDFDTTLSQNNGTIIGMKNALVITLLFIVALTLFIGLYLSSQIEHALKELIASVKKITAGDLLVRVPVVGKDEISILAFNINLMAAQLQNLYQSIAQSVSEKTEKLAQKVEETEKLNKFMVGREIKMVELKRENEKLQKELEETKKTT